MSVRKTDIDVLTGTLISTACVVRDVTPLLPRPVIVQRETSLTMFALRVVLTVTEHLTGRIVTVGSV